MIWNMKNLLITQYNQKNYLNSVVYLGQKMFRFIKERFSSKQCTNEKIHLQRFNK